MIFRGRQTIWMMIDYFKTFRSLQEQYMLQDIEICQWPGDDKLQWFYSRWKLITTSLTVTILDVVLRDTFRAKIRHSKRPALDLVEFDRMREEDPKRTIKLLTDSIDRALSRDRME
ncbi:MAG: hypothetical protein ACKPKO_32985, partial [Candidatus Fonsibacter sp.]